MFDFTDPFGKGRIRELEYELKHKTCEMQGEIEYYRERALEASHVASYLAELMENQYKDLQESRKSFKDLGQMLQVSEQARKNLAEKNRELGNSLEINRKRFDELSEKYDQLAELRDSDRRELEELYAEHDALVREIRDGQHGTEAAEPEAMSA